MRGVVLVLVWFGCFVFVFVVSFYFFLEGYFVEGVFVEVVVLV